tara:strand:- start:27 stop:215 length:189 start_codon:yes stop_codon:yes gene_type:complete
VAFARLVVGVSNQNHAPLASSRGPSDLPLSLLIVVIVCFLDLGSRSDTVGRWNKEEKNCEDA